MSISAAAATQRHKALSLYKALLIQASHIIQTQQRTQAIAQIKQDFRSHKGETEVQKIETLLVAAYKKIGFLKIISARNVRPHRGVQQYTLDEATQTLVPIANEDDEYTKPGAGKAKKAISNWGQGNVDPEQLQKHERLMRRMQFKDGPMKDYPKHAYGAKKW